MKLTKNQRYVLEFADRKTHGGGSLYPGDCCIGTKAANMVMLSLVKRDLLVRAKVSAHTRAYLITDAGRLALQEAQPNQPKA